MKKNLLLFLVISTLICLSSCASQNWKNSKEDISKAIKAKIDSREYRIDMKPEVVHRGDNVFQYVPGYIHVCGDSIISCTIHDNPFEGELPSKNYIENMQSFKYAILDYQQMETRQGRVVISFRFNMKYQENDVFSHLPKFKDGLFPVQYKLIFGKSTKVKVEMNEIFTSGTLKL